MYYYLVSFSHERGFGHIEVSRNTPITTIEDINGIARDLQERLNTLSEIVILNYQLLRKEP